MMNVFRFEAPGEGLSYNQFYGFMSLLLQGGLLISVAINGPA